MKNAEALGVQGRFERLEPQLLDTFDFRKMIAFSSGSSWKSASEEQRNQLADAFARMSIATYASQFNGYANETFDVLGEREGPRGSILVDTRIVRNPEHPVAITYVMGKIGDQWRVIDILLEKTVSEMARPGQRTRLGYCSRNTTPS